MTTFKNKVTEFLVPGSLYKLPAYTVITFVCEPHGNKELSGEEVLFLVDYDRDLKLSNTKTWACFLYGEQRLWVLVDNNIIDRHLLKIS